MLNEQIENGGNTHLEIVADEERETESVVRTISIKDSLKQSAHLGAMIGLNLLIGTAGVYGNTVLIARLDTEGKNLAASNLINSYQNVVIASSNAVLFSVSSCVGNAYGAGNLQEIPVILKNSLVIVGTLTFISLPLLLTSDLILKGLRQPSDLADITQNYFEGYVIGVPAYFLLGVEQQISFGTFNILPANVISLINASLTAGVGFVLMYGKLHFPALGVRGLGYASSISNWVSLLGFTAYLKYSSRFNRFGLISLTGSWFDKKILKKLVVVGAPIGIQVSIEFLSLIMSTAIIGALMKIDDLKANEIAIQYIFAAVVPIYGLGQACSILTGQARGRKNLLDARKLAHTSIGLGIGFSMLAIILFCAIPKVLMSPFLNVEDPKNADIIDATRYLLIINGVNQLFDATRIISAGALQGTFANTIFAMVVGAVTMCLIAVPLGYALALPAGLGVAGIYLGRSSGMLLGGPAVFAQWLRKINRAIGESGISAPQQPYQIDQSSSQARPSVSQRPGESAGLYFSRTSPTVPSTGAGAGNNDTDETLQPLLAENRQAHSRWRCSVM